MKRATPDSAGSDDQQRGVLDKGQRPGDILLFYHPEGTSRLIAWLTRSPYYHVAVCSDTYHVIESRPRGVMRRDLRTREGGHVFRVIPAPRDSGPDVHEWASGEIGAKYDPWDVPVIILDRIFLHLHLNYKAPSNRFTCGEFVARAFQQAGICLFPELKLEDVIPADFARLLPPTEPAEREKPS